MTKSLMKTAFWSRKFPPLTHIYPHKQYDAMYKWCWHILNSNLIYPTLDHHHHIPAYIHSRLHDSIEVAIQKWDESEIAESKGPSYSPRTLFSFRWIIFFCIISFFGRHLLMTCHGDNDSREKIRQLLFFFYSS